MKEKEDELRRMEEKDLPWFYRLILKIPGTDLLEGAGGIFWGILAPIFLMGEFLLSLYFILIFRFPINIILALIIPTATFMLFVKISLKRFINWWNATFGEAGFRWDIEKSMKEYLDLLGKQKEKDTNKP